MNRLSHCLPTALCWGALVLTVAGCATPPPPPSPPKVSVVLLPQSDAAGNPIPTAVSITMGAQSQQLDKPFALVETDNTGQLNQRASSAEEVQSRHGNVLKMQPPSPEVVVLRFLPGKSQLTPESEQQLPELIQRATARAGGEILVIGHTDRVGSLDANDALSLQRAKAVISQFKARGFSSDLLTAIGRGEREPAVPTEDEVAEPLNRRAEVIIR